MVARTVAVAAALTALALTACYESEPARPNLPAWYWHTGPTSADLYDVADVNASDCWAVGAAGATTGIVLHYTGYYWTVDNALPEAGVPPLYAVDALDDGTAWAAGGGDYFVYQQLGEWKSYPHPAPGTDVYGLALVSAGEGWAVGEGGAIFRFANGSWAAVPSPTSATLRRVRALSATSAWAVGDRGTILHYDGAAWTAVTVPGNVNLGDVFLFADDDVWVVGDGALIGHWDGKAWLMEAGPGGSVNYRCCTFAAADAGWAGGDKTLVAQYNGEGWSAVENLPSGGWTLAAMHAVSNREAWAVGPNGTILHYK